MPKAASAPAMANAYASGRHARPRPFLMQYMAPPTRSPRALRSRYLTASRTSAYLVAIPRKAATHIQNITPGPPSAMARVTPAMLPVPTVPPSAVASAWNGDIPPPPPERAKRRTVPPMHAPKCRSCTAPLI